MKSKPKAKTMTSSRKSKAEHRYRNPNRVKGHMKCNKATLTTVVLYDAGTKTRLAQTRVRKSRKTPFYNQWKKDSEGSLGKGWSQDRRIQEFFNMASSYRYYRGYYGGHRDIRILYCAKCKGWHRRTNGCLDDGIVENCSWCFGHDDVRSIFERNMSADRKASELEIVRAARKIVAEGGKPGPGRRFYLDRYCARKHCELCDTAHSKMEGCPNREEAVATPPPPVPLWRQLEKRPFTLMRYKQFKHETMKKS